MLTGILGTLLVSAGPALAHDDMDHQFRDQKHQVHDAVNAGVISPQQHQVLDSKRNMQHAALDNSYAAPGAYPGTAYPNYNYNYTNQGYGAGHINNPAINPGHNNSIGHRVGDALNGNQAMNPSLYQQNGLGQGYGLPVQGYGAHINDPTINPGHNNSIGHQMGDAALNGNGSQVVNPGYGVNPIYGYTANPNNPNYSAYPSDSAEHHGHSHQH